MVVHLQRQRAARLDHDAFDLKPLPRIDTVVPAPGTKYFAVQKTFGVSFALEALHDGFDILRVALIGDQHRVGGFHHHQTLHTHADQ